MEDLVPFLVMIGYLVLRFLGKLAGKQSGKEQGEGGPAKGSHSVEDILQELMGDLGVEPPVVEEHRPTKSEQQWTPSEHRATLSEAQPTLSEHQQSEAERFAVRSEHRPTASEHLESWGEHLKGDYLHPPVPLVVPATAGQGERSKFGQALVQDLRGGSQALAKAIVLNEILGPPVSLRSDR